jgi:hypothetical protein
MIRVNPTLAFTLILLSTMVGAGVVSGSWGYILGREALRGITQPETRPGQVADTDGESAPRSGLTILNEDEIINDVRARMAGNTPTAAVTSPTTSITDRSTDDVESNNIASPESSTEPPLDYVSDTDEPVETTEPDTWEESAPVGDELYEPEPFLDESGAIAPVDESAPVETDSYLEDGALEPLSDRPLDEPSVVGNSNSFIQSSDMTAESDTDPTWRTVN